MRKRLPLIPNLVTACGLGCGLFVIFLCTIIPSEHMTRSMTQTLVLILLLASVLDFLDGALARALNAQTAFGGLFDSLADAISFGVAPSVLVLNSVVWTGDEPLPYLLMASCMTYTLCGVIRLIRFSTEALSCFEEPVEKPSTGKFFVGLPIPAAACALSSAFLCLMSLDLSSDLRVYSYVRVFVCVVVPIFLGYLMVSRLLFPSLKKLRVPVLSFRTILCSVLFLTSVLFGVIHNFPVVFLILVWSYICLGLLTNRQNRLQGG